MIEMTRPPLLLATLVPPEEALEPEEEVPDGADSGADATTGV